MSEPLISVIMPAYNHERFVQDAIRSIMAQTYQNLELIVIDDGSKDKTWEKIQKLEPECRKRFTNVSLSTQKNQGTCETYNRLVKAAQGEYIYLIASDDMAQPQAIEKLYEAISEENYVLAVGNENFINSAGEQIGVDAEFQPQPLEKAKYQTFCDFYDGETKEDYFHSEIFGSYVSFLKRNYIPNGNLIRASALKQITYTKEAPLEDLFMHLQLSKIGKYKFVDEVLFCYRLHGHNTISDREHIWKMSEKTMLYERDFCQTSPEIQKLFRDATRNKSYLNLGFIQIYQRKFLGRKAYYLNLCGKEFMLAEKKSAAIN